MTTEPTWTEPSLDTHALRGPGGVVLALVGRHANHSYYWRVLGAARDGGVEESVDEAKRAARRALREREDRP